MLACQDRSLSRIPELVGPVLARKPQTMGVFVISVSILLALLQVIVYETNALSLGKVSVTSTHWFLS